MSSNQPLSAADVRTSRSSSFSQQSDDSQTAVEYVLLSVSDAYKALRCLADRPTLFSFLRDQQLLEADAREALPYVRMPSFTLQHGAAWP